MFNFRHDAPSQATFNPSNNYCNRTINSFIKINIKLHTITPSPIKSELVTRKPNDENFEQHIFTSSKKILVKQDHAQLIDKFSLHRGFEFNCHERYLPIEFQVTGTNKDRKEEV